ncbi:prenyltransferase/squalene oxidase repeat-containing protein [Vallitalea maricola]|uniref:Uncharacterized protein n=1 Tax=Vallitalea maricola TaxID=3074433 RepID=A0ACB5UHA5_9FIRM|nr:hypothetical protein AN2V17_10660 [Vallitalea sp. AN17-2]
MNQLTKELFEKCKKYILEKGRPLEQHLFINYFVKPCELDIINDLKKYQNTDGGFGNGIESDFTLPYSSPMATSIGLRYLSRYDNQNEAILMIKKAIAYLENTYVPERKGWFAVPREVNDFPHAPWWNYDEEKGMTIIDKYWGNPSAELIGYLYKYREYVANLDVDNILEYAINNINSREVFESQHEIYCYIDLYHTLPKKLADRLEGTLEKAIRQLANTHVDEWEDYVPKPLDFIDNPNKTYGIDEESINTNLDYYIDNIKKNNIIIPTWAWNDYEEQWKIAKVEWTALITLNGLCILDKFNRIEK